MLRLLSIFIDVFSAAIIVIPVLLILQKFLWKSSPGKRKILILLFSLYLCAVFSITGIPAVNNLVLDFSFNPVPFLDITGSGIGGFIKGFLLNILLFIPLGMMLPVLWDKCKDLRYTLLFGLGLSALIETLQIFTLRLSDIDDLIANMIGAAAGFAVTWLLNRRKPYGENDTGSGAKELFGTLSLSFAVMFCIEPFISNMLWEIILH